MTDLPPHSLSKPQHRNRWLILIAAFKLAQALLFVAIGVGALKLLHKDVDDVLEHLANYLRFNQEVGLVKFILKKAALVDDRLLKRVVEAFFIYAGLDLIEGIGLYLEKTWAEYLTLAITASFLPLEVFEVFRRITLIRVSLLVANTLVFIYLLKLVAERAKRARGSGTDEPGA
jgi:uncharacterized membrane protein (DUF2068 family)